jgi:hypothetical protein
MCQPDPPEWQRGGAVLRQNDSARRRAHVVRRLAFRRHRDRTLASLLGIEGAPLRVVMDLGWAAAMRARAGA